MSLLLVAIILTPLLQWLGEIFLKSDRLKNFNEKFAMIFSSTILYAIYNKLPELQTIEIAGFTPDIALRFSINQSNIIYLLLLNFVWIICQFYMTKFFIIEESGERKNFKLFFITTICATTYILAADNLLTLLFSYNFLVFIIYFFTTKCFFKSQTRGTKIFSSLLFSESFLLLCGIILTKHFGGNLDFSNPEALNEIGASQIGLLFSFYFGAIFLTIFSMSQLFYHKNCEPSSLYSYPLLLLFLGLAKLFIFTKIITSIFGFVIFSSMVEKINFEVFAIIFIVFLCSAHSILLFSRNLKAIFFHLFFTQLLVAFFAIIICAIYDQAFINKALISFVLNLTLVFLTFSSLILYLKKAQNKDPTGLFYQLRVTLSLLLFGLLSLVGAVPGIGMIEKFSLIKIAFDNELFFTKIFFILNSLCILLITIKLFFSLFTKITTARVELDKKLAAKIDTGSSLMLSSLLVAIIILILPIISIFY